MTPGVLAFSEDALTDKLRRLRLALLAAECRKLDPSEEQSAAEEGLRGV